MKTSELIGAKLDWAVAKCKELPLKLDPMGFKKDAPKSPQAGWWVWYDVPSKENSRLVGHDYSPSTNWAQGGPIIDREGIDLYCNVPTNPEHKDIAWRGSWRAKYHRCSYGTDMFHGETALIAAMRCFVSSKLGAEIDIPEELK